MDVATYTGCRYEGGFTGMKASNKATLILSDDRVTLTRPRVLIGSRKNNVMKLWTRWNAVIDLDVVRGSDGGTRIEIATKSRGTGQIVVPGVEPIEVWEALDRVDDLRGRIPPRVRKALDGEAPLEEAPADLDDRRETGPDLPADAEDERVVVGGTADPPRDGEADPATPEGSAETSGPAAETAAGGPSDTPPVADAGGVAGD